MKFKCPKCKEEFESSIDIDSWFIMISKAFTEFLKERKNES